MVVGVADCGKTREESNFLSGRRINKEEGNFHGSPFLLRWRAKLRFNVHNWALFGVVLLVRLKIKNKNKKTRKKSEGWGGWGSAINKETFYGLFDKWVVRFLNLMLFVDFFLPF